MREVWNAYGDQGRERVMLVMRYQEAREHTYAALQLRYMQVLSWDSEQ